MADELGILPVACKEAVVGCDAGVPCMLLVKSSKGGEGSGTKRRPRHPPDSLNSSSREFG